MPRYPVNEPLYITTEFGVPDSNAKFGKHAGLDFGLRMGDPEFAPVSGTVTDYVWSAAHGHTVQIFDGQYYHKLCHNSVLLVKPGDKVTEGQQVAKAGSSGLSSGPHCHYDISPSKFPASFDFINPHEFIGASMVENWNNQEYDSFHTLAYGGNPGPGYYYDTKAVINRASMDYELQVSLERSRGPGGLMYQVEGLKAQVADLEKQLAASNGNFIQTNVTQDGKPLYKKG